MTNTTKILSKLRFPEFKIAEEWEVVKLGDVIKIINPHKKLQSCDYKKDGIYPIIDQSQKYICGYTDDNESLLNEDKDFLIVFGDHTCILKSVDFPFAQGADGIKIFRSKMIDRVGTKYIYQFLLSKPIDANEYKRHFSELKEIEIVFPPSLPEQQKIAAFLTSLDEQISAHTKKLEALKAHKKGLMQQLFPANGEKTPKLRFPEFKNAGEWEDVRLGEVFKRITDRNKENNNNVLTISAQYGLVNQYEYFSKNIAAIDVTNYYIIRKGDFAYNKSRSQGYPYGAIKPLKLYDKGVVSTLYICFRTKEQNSCIDFYEHYFETDLIHNEIGKIAQEGARNHGLLNISTEDFFEKISLFIPSFPEQQKIASFLSSIDEMIQAQDDKIRKLKTYKNGLMQQMFAK